MPKGGEHLAASPGVTPGLYQRFIDYLDARPTTIETYTKAIRQLFAYLTSNGITHPQREDIIAFREELKVRGRKPATVQNYLTASKLFFKWLAQEGLYPNVADNIKGARLDREHKKDYLTSRQVKTILGEVNLDSLQGLRDYAILVLLVTGGLRTIEVARADVGDLRTIGDNTVLYIQGKGRDEKSEFINVTVTVERAIRAYLTARGAVTDTEPLFTSTSNNSKGKRLSTRTISGIAKGSMRAAGYNSARLTAHSFRHTAITLSLMAGKGITEVQQFARHANITSTMIYNHALDRAKNTCSEAIAAAIF